MKILLLLLILLTSFSLYAEGGSNDIPPVPVRAGAQILNYDGNSYLAVSYSNHPHWHTYWKNPGDAGLPVDVKLFRSGDRVIYLKEVEWPTPRRFIENGGIIAYGYEGEYTRFFHLEVNNYEGEELRLVSKWLVCKHICIPGKLETRFMLKNGQIESGEFTQEPISNEVLRTRLEAVPSETEFPTNLDLVLEKTESGLIFYYNLSSVSIGRLHQNINLLTPMPQDLFTFKKEQLFKDSKNNLYGKMEMDWDGEYENPVIELPADGKFANPYEMKFLFANPNSGKVEVISKSIASFGLSGHARMQEFYKLLTPVMNQTGKPHLETSDSDGAGNEQSSGGKSYLLYLLFAFIGGLILNIMPCVLPVISIKLFGLLQIRDESPKRIFKHNMMYTLGVLVTFAALGAVVASLKAGGESVGWGFHLQSPKFILLMIIILIVFAMNLFGLFEFGTPGGRNLGGIAIKESAFGDFFGGVLATILSTPCSAPFLGTALTFAFTTSTFTLFLVFLMVGIGLAFPFIITAFFPKTIHLLPKPGMWMDHLKKFLGLTLLLTVVWLMDVLTALVDTSRVLIFLNTGLAFLFFAFYLQAKITKKFHWLIVAFLIPTLFLGKLFISDIAAEAGGTSDLVSDKSKSMGLEWQKWSPEKMDELKGQLVFIDFTAKWCFTCKVNERLVLHTNGFKDLTTKYNVKLLLGDWTKRDSVIGDFLKKNGLVGVPAYFIQKADGTLINLGETITLGKIEEHLK